MGQFRETGSKREVTVMISTATANFRLAIVSGEKQREYDRSGHFVTQSESRKSGGLHYGDVQHPITYHLDLCGAAAMARLRLIATFWPAWPTETRQLWLQRQEIALPPRALCDQDVAILPGGAVTVRGPDGILVCDPAEAVTLAGIEAKELRTALRRRTDAIHLLHGDSGIVRNMRLPVRLPPQAVTIIQDASRLPGHLASAGPVLIQWCSKGAVAWPMVESPLPFALAGSVAAMPVAARGQPLITEHWDGADVEARCRLLGPGIVEHASDILGDEFPDDLKDALIDSCVAGPDGLIRRIAAGLAMLPACFQAEASMPPGGRPMAWRSSIAYIDRTAPPQALLGFENVADPVTALRALRNLLDFPDALVVMEVSDVDDAEPVPLRQDAALFLGRRTHSPAKIGVIVPVPAMPVDLYALASSLADSLGAAVTAVAPCWGFCHRIDADGDEAGNAGWFGMGAGIEEMDVLIGDV
jgi:hypothetical protein